MPFYCAAIFTQDYAHWLATDGDNVVGEWVAQALADDMDENHTGVVAESHESVRASEL